MTRKNTVDAPVTLEHTTKSTGTSDEGGAQHANVVARSGSMIKNVTRVQNARCGSMRRKVCSESVDGDMAEVGCMLNEDRQVEY
jgi:hypothetical protein